MNGLLLDGTREQCTNVRTEELPMLHDGSTVVAGYQSIVSHLRSTSPEYDLDASLSPSQAADSTAYLCL